ncbi:hypothetical protein BB987_09585 [Photorhabdus temperata]|nr:hypothetical protein BB987_09585 [Photorhabdus temperata]
MGISKKSSGIKSDYDLAEKFFVIKKKRQIFFRFDENDIFCTSQPGQWLLIIPRYFYSNKVKREV